MSVLHDAAHRWRYTPYPDCGIKRRLCRRQLQSLVVGTLRKAELLDPESSAELFRATLRHCGERRGLTCRGVKAHDSAVVGGATRRGERCGADRGQCCRGHAPPVRANDRHDAHLSPLITGARQVTVAGRWAALSYNLKRPSMSRAFSAFCGSHSTS